VSRRNLHSSALTMWDLATAGCRSPAYGDGMPSVAPSSPSRFRTVVAGLAAASLLAGCGSTVQVRGTATLGGNGLAAPGGNGTGGAVVDPQTGLAVGGTGSGTGGSGTSATTGSSGVPVGGSGGTTGGTAGGGTAGGTGSSTGAAAALPAKGFGWDEKNVYFGVVTQNDAQKAFASFGANQIDPGDTMGQAQAVADYVNAHGGILGRTLVVKPKDVATVDTAQNPEATGQRVCTYFTQDQPVIAVMSIVTLMDYPNFRTCLAKKRVPLFNATVKLADDRSAAELAPYFTQTAAVSWTRLAPVMVSRLKAQGWLGSWDVRTGAPGTAPTKVGIVADSTAAGVRTGKLLQSEFAKAGYPGALTFNYVNASDGQSASVNYFNQNGVTHVIVTDVELLAFQSSAQSQQYKPRYGVSSYNALYTNVETSPLAPPGAQNGAMGVGWAPALDVGESQDPHASPGKAACEKVMTAGKQNLSGKRLAQVIAYSFCDVIELLQQGASTSGGLTGTALLSGMNAVAPRFATAVGFSMALSADRHFLPGTVRDLFFDTGCSCYRYAKPTAGL
jgi:Tfp pilus assembly protein FimT